MTGTHVRCWDGAWAGHSCALMVGGRIYVLGRVGWGESLVAICDNVVEWA